MNRLKKHLFFTIMLVIVLVFLLKIVIPFLLFSNLKTWDMAGHYFSVWFYKNHLFPKYSGWNPYFYLGFSQGVFYPPLFHYLAAALSFLTKIEIALKIMIVLPVLLLPFSFYCFVRHFDFKKEESLVSTIIFSLILFLAPSWVGGGFKATFTTGLIVNNFALPIFFFYLIVLDKKLKQQKPLFPSIVFSLLLLTHLPSAVSALLMTIVLAALSWKENKTSLKKAFLFSFFFIVNVLAFTSFWLIPFICFQSLSGAETLPMLFKPFDALLLISSIFIFVYPKQVKQREKKLAIMVLAILLFSFSAIHEGLPVTFHFYRIQSFAYLLSPALLISILKTWGLKFKKELSVFLLLFLLITSLVVKFPFEKVELTELNLGNVSGRILFSKETEEDPVHLHVINNEISLQNPNNESITGLFMESNFNSYFVMALLQKLDEKNFIWGIPLLERVYLKLYENRFSKEDFYRLFNITHLLTLSDKFSTDSGKLVTLDPHSEGVFLNERFLFLKKVQDDSLIEPLDYQPLIIKKGNWKETVKEWFLKKGKKEIVLDAKTIKNGLKTENIADNETIKDVVYHTDNKDQLSFFVDSEKPLPLLVKISYFPKWHAYQDGKEIPIIQASPSLIFLYGKGKIDLKYEDLKIEKIGRLISLVSIVLASVYYIFRKFYG